MANDLKALLTDMKNSHLNHAHKLKNMADAGVKISMDGSAETIEDMIKREYDAAERLKQTIERMV